MQSGTGGSSGQENIPVQGNRGVSKVHPVRGQYLVPSANPVLPGNNHPVDAMDHPVCAGNIRDGYDSAAEDHDTVFFCYLDGDAETGLGEVQFLYRAAREVAKEDMVLEDPEQLP